MLRSSSSRFALLSLLGLALSASASVACSGRGDANSDVDSSLQAVKKKDGRPTGDGATCSWSGITTVTPPSTSGSSGGCNTLPDGTYQCWSYAEDGTAVGLPTKESGSTTSSSGWTGTSSGGTSSGGSEPTPMPEPVAETYNVGDWFPSLDGCNKCTCTDIGIMCTVNACPAPPPPPSPGCDVDGKWFAAGDRFGAPDNCNTCSCGPDGQVACTEMACVDPTPPPVGKSCLVYGKEIESGTYYVDGCNECACTDGEVSCTKKGCAPVSPTPKK